MSDLPFRDLDGETLPLFGHLSLKPPTGGEAAVIAAAVDCVRASHAYEQTPFGDRERARFLAMLEQRLDEAGIRW